MILLLRVVAPTYHNDSLEKPTMPNERLFDRVPAVPELSVDISPFGGAAVFLTHSWQERLQYQTFSRKALESLVKRLVKGTFEYFCSSVICVLSLGLARKTWRLSSNALR